MPDLAGYGAVTGQGAGKATLAVPRDQVAAIASRILAELDVLDLTIEDPPIEDVIEQTFRSGDTEHEATGEARP